MPTDPISDAATELDAAADGGDDAGPLVPVGMNLAGGGPPDCHLAYGGHASGGGVTSVVLIVAVLVCRMFRRRA